MGIRFGFLAIVYFFFFATSCKTATDSNIGEFPSLDGGETVIDNSKILISVDNGEISLNEGGQLVFVVLFNRPVPSNTSIFWSLPASALSDFTLTGGEVELSAGEVSAAIRIESINDLIYEGNENFSITISGDDDIFYQDTIVPIELVESQNSPQLSFSSSSQNVNESDGSVTATIQLSVPTSTSTTLSFILSGIATEGAGGDYILASNTLAINPGELTVDLNLALLDDVSIETLEDVVITLQSVTSGFGAIDSSNNTHSISILDDDSGGSFSISGAQGGADTTSDAWLADGSEVTLHWIDAATEVSYRATILEADGTTVRCAEHALAADVTTHTFSGCSLVEGNTYRARVIANNGTSDFGPSNQLFSFVVDTTPPGAFNIIGVSGGLDVIPDNSLTGGVNPVLNWVDSVGESQYSLTIYENDGITVKCPTEQKVANSPAHSFSSCDLTNGQNYRAEVIAADEAGHQTTASNSLFSFSVNTSPAAFSISGATGGVLDLTADNELSDGLAVVANWNDTVGESSYDVGIYEADGVTVRCPVVNVSANTSSHVFTGCSLSLNESYRIYVAAKDISNSTFVASNNFYSFTVTAGLYLSGTGGSHLNGVPLTACGGGDTCGVANPYVENTSLTVLRIKLENGAVMTGGGWTSGPVGVGNGQLEVTVGDFEICSTCIIDMNAKGYTSTQGAGTGGSGSASSYGGGGASYGGYGGASEEPNSGGLPYGNTKAPISIGSGGGNSFNAHASGGAGGGSIRIVSTGSFILDGTIRANGEDGAIGLIYGGGGGSGGSILIDAQVISGAGGRLESSGGNGGNVANEGGGGSGGRVALTYTGDSYTGGVSFISGVLFGGSGHVNGAPGTYFLQDTVLDPNGIIKVDNNGVHSSNRAVILSTLSLSSIETNNQGALEVPAGVTLTLPNEKLGGTLAVEGTLSLPSNSFTIENGGQLIWKKNTTLSLIDLTIESGGELTHEQNQDSLDYQLDLSVSNNLLLNGAITVDGKGFAPTFGTSLACDGGIGFAGCGGSHASIGGYGDGTQNTSATVYGQIKAPITFGSGGGTKSGDPLSVDSLCARGGGIAKINVGNTLTLNGSISANGNMGCPDSTISSGGGAGGSVNVTTSTLAGIAGNIFSNGGSSFDNIYDAGGGSGGRVSLIFDSDTYTGSVSNLNMTASGGWGFSYGGAGTIYLKDTVNDTHGHLLIENVSSGNFNGVNSTPIVGNEQYDSIVGRNGGVLQIPLGASFTLPSNTIDYNIEVEGTMVFPSGNDLVIANGGSLIWRKNSILNLDNLTINSGGSMTHSKNSNTLEHQLVLNITGNLTVDGEINVDGKGYAPTLGATLPCNGGIGFSGCGGFHAGYGGEGYESSHTGSTIYGSIKSPQTLGGGGGTVGGNDYGGTSFCGRGGGVAIIDVGGTLTLNGTISSNGVTGCTDGNYSGGGGAGGSIKIVTSVIAGAAGYIRANGGAGGDSTFDGGGGSGGRISLVYDSDIYSGGFGSITQTAFGGWGENYGSPGVIYQRDTVNDIGGYLSIDNNGQGSINLTGLLADEDFDGITVTGNGQAFIPGGATFTLPSNTLDFPLAVTGTMALPSGGDLTIANGGVLNWAKDEFQPLSLNNLTIESGGELTHQLNRTTADFKLFVNVANFTLDNGGLVNVIGKGFGSASGPGAGASRVSTLHGGGGGAYGGAGGDGFGPTAGGVSYGNINDPVDLGSGGSSGDCDGSAGGGAFVLSVSGNLTLNGSVMANGSDSIECLDSGGGGSGGSINIVTDTLLGSTGSLAAVGGNADDDSDDGGGGGGGRIRLTYSVDSYTGGEANLGKDVSAGTGVNNGVTGTVSINP